MTNNEILKKNTHAHTVMYNMIAAPNNASLCHRHRSAVVCELLQDASIAKNMPQVHE